MFRIFVRVSWNSEHRWLTGLDAVDESRRLGLDADGERQMVKDDTAAVEVSEEFARAYFDSRSSGTEMADVTFAMLGPTDVQLVGQRVKFADNLPAARVVELFHAGRMRTLKLRVAELERELEEAEKETETEAA